jgi:hypothetical protein
MDDERYILIDENNVVLAVVKATSVFDILDTGIPYFDCYRVIDMVPEVGEKYYKN